VRFVREFESALRAIHSCRTRFRVVHYSIQGDHVHLIVEAATTRDLSCGMKSVGARLARSVHRAFAWTGAVLADRFHLHVLRTPREVRNAIAYVLLNARRHLAKLGRRLDPRAPVDPASSGRWFDGWRAAAVFVAAQSLDGAPPAICPARTWLLSSGWRRHGLIEPREVPGTS